LDILYLAHRIPYPPNKGDKIRSCHQLEYLSKRHRVWCACFVDDPQDMIHVEKLRQWCEDVAAIPMSPRLSRVRGLIQMAAGGTVTEGCYRNRKMTRVLRRWSSERTFDAALFFSSSVASYRSDVRARRSVLDFCDFESLKWSAYADRSRGLRSRMFALESRRLRLREAQWLNEFDACVVITEAEALERNIPIGTPGVHVIGNGAALGNEPQATADEAPLRIGFVGQMDYQPNVEAVRWFADRVLPQVRCRVPEATFEIVGRSPTRDVLALGDRRAIRVTGAVDDVRAHLEGFAVSVAPLRMGWGVQNKVLEAMAACRPVVASSAAAAGIDAVDGRHLVVADEPDAMSEQIVRLLRSPTRRLKLGSAARQRLSARYSWQRELAKLEALLVDVRNDRPANFA
jgi:sugar transferase (PEP-CTERM/EpsH1 system associated)